MTERRNFNAAERMALFVHANGKCMKCGDELGDDWHADHVQPYSKGGATDVLNGQALCADCNRKKGNKLETTQRIELREFQQRFVDRATEKAKKGIKELICNVCAGSGKTLGSQAAADSLIKSGYIEQVVVFVPRLNLAAQYELDWEYMQNRLPYQTVMRSLHHTDNTLPLLYPSASGYVTTYASLWSEPMLHIRQIAQKRTLIILDEAHQLGIDEMGVDSTKSAEYVAMCAEKAVMVFVMSGTPYRADGKPLLFAYPDYYAEPDVNGYRRLMPDLEATYRDGVREGYLRRFEATLADGGYTWRDLAGNETKLLLSDREASVYQALQLDEVWKPLTDTFVEKLQNQKLTVDNRLCGLIACGNQKQAREVETYLKKYHHHMRTIIAVSDDGSKAQTALRDFKTGRYDILVTVSMAYIGYDHKPINTVLLLTHFRSSAYLEQLVARGLRVWGEVALERQACHVIAPNDPDMVDFVEFMRSESDAGYSEYRKRELPKGPNDGPNEKEPPLGYATDGYISELRAMGIDPMGDLSPSEYAYAEQLRRSMGLPYPATDLIAFHRRMSEFTVQGQTQQERPTRTLKEQIKSSKDQLHQHIKRLTSLVGDSTGDYDEAKKLINKRLYRLYGSIKNVKSVEDVRQRSATVLKWMAKGQIDNEK